MLKVSDLKPQTITVNVTMGYEVVDDPETGKKKLQGREVSTTLQLLTKHRWEEIGFSVDDPVPDKKENGSLDYDSMSYRIRSNRAIQERNIRRLCYALEKGGDFDFEGAVGFEEQVSVLRDIDAGVFNALFTELQNATNAFNVKVSTSAAAFPRRNGNGRVLESAVKDIEPQAVES
jgi:hypothetical protein